MRQFCVNFASKRDKMRMRFERSFPYCVTVSLLCLSVIIGQASGQYEFSELNVIDDEGDGPWRLFVIYESIQFV